MGSGDGTAPTVDDALLSELQSTWKLVDDITALSPIGGVALASGVAVKIIDSFLKGPFLPYVVQLSPLVESEKLRSGL